MVDIFTPSPARKARNPLNERQLSNLRDARDWSSRRLQVFRENRMDAIEQVTGANYGAGGRAPNSQFNMLELALNTYMRQLVGPNPQVICKSKRSSLRAVATELEIATNFVLEKIKYGKQLRRVVMDAMYCMGIMKTGVTEPGEEHHEGYMHVAGRPFADPVDLSDWVHDMNARVFEEVEFAGHCFRVPLERVLDSPLYNAKAKNEIYRMAREYNDSTRMHTERPETLSQGVDPMPIEYRDTIMLWELWLPVDNLVCTMMPNHGPPLRVDEYEGPEEGPYDLLGFMSVPNNVIPLAPMMVWEDLADLINALHVKAGEQLDRQKTVLAGRGNAANSIEKIRNTGDGETAIVDTDPNLIKEFSLGGADPNLMAGLINFRDAFSYQAGNLDALGGLGPQSGTVGQDQLLNEAASSRVKDMQEQVTQFVTDTTCKIAFYLWQDPDVELPLTKKITQTIDTDFTWTSDSRAGDFFDYNFRIAPYSLRAKSPGERLATIQGLMQQILIPLLPQFEAQGLHYDWPQFLRLVSHLANVPELEEFIYEDTGRSLMDQDAAIAPGGKSPVTTRNYNRMSGPGGGSRQGRDQQMAAAFLSSAGQQGNQQQPQQGQASGAQ